MRSGTWRISSLCPGGRILTSVFGAVAFAARAKPSAVPWYERTRRASRSTTRSGASIQQGHLWAIRSLPQAIHRLRELGARVLQRGPADGHGVGGGPPFPRLEDLGVRTRFRVDAVSVHEEALLELARRSRQLTFRREAGRREFVGLHDAVSNDPLLERPGQS